MKIVPINGDLAVAYAAKQMNPDVVAAYPITPQTIIVEKFSDYVANGEVDTEYVCTESEHSAMSACIGASAAGGRVFTSTASQGLALMWEMLYIASAYRLPIIMAVVNRALSGPINIHGDHSDTMGARDSGWIQMYGENPQEAYDNTIMAFKIAEATRIPTMSMIDGFITSHCVERVVLEDDDTVKNFVGEYTPKNPLLDIKHPVTYGPFSMPDYYFEHKRQLSEAVKAAKGTIKTVSEEYSKLVGRDYGIISEYMMDDAEVAIVVMSSTAGTTRTVVNMLREQGMKVGMVKLRLFRPFPAEELVEALKKVKAVAVMDRAETYGAHGGQIFLETRSALYSVPEKPAVLSYIFGLGGKEIRQEDIAKVYKDLDAVAKGETRPELNYIGVRD